MFEKYDGVRGIWNPHHKLFYSRSGKPFSFPQFIIHSMPNIFLEGELWFGRDTFQEAMQLTRRTDPSLINWKNFKYEIFDCPTYPGTYQERYNYLGLLL